MLRLQAPPGSPITPISPHPHTPPPPIVLRNTVTRVHAGSTSYASKWHLSLQLALPPPLLQKLPASVDTLRYHSLLIKPKAGITSVQRTALLTALQGAVDLSPLSFTVNDNVESDQYAFTLQILDVAFNGLTAAVRRRGQLCR